MIDDIKDFMLEHSYDVLTERNKMSDTFPLSYMPEYVKSLMDADDYAYCLCAVSMYISKFCLSMFSHEHISEIAGIIYKEVFNEQQRYAY